MDEDLFELIFSILWLALPAPSWTDARNSVLNGWERAKDGARRLFRH